MTNSENEQSKYGKVFASGFFVQKTSVKYFPVQTSYLVNKK